MWTKLFVLLIAVTSITWPDFVIGQGSQVDIGEVPKPRVLPEFRRLAHGLRSGNITILNAKTFYIPNLHYDGNGPDSYFWVGNGSAPDTTGIKVPNEMGSLDVLRGYQGEDIVIQLPGNLTVYDIDWLAVYCVRYKHNYGHVMIPKDLDVPPALGQTKVSVDIGEVSKLRVLPEFRRLAHGLRSGNITILNAKTFYIPNLHYDGNGPDAYFWVGNGSAPDTMGIKVPNEMGSLDVLRGYQGEDIVIQLPGNLTVYDIDWLAVYCVRYKHNYGHVMIPKDLDVPPALGHTKVSVDIGEVPKPRVLPEFRRLAHGLRSGNIIILNAKTFYIPNLHYDGNGPDAYFWVGNGSAPDTTGIKVPNEMGSLDVLRGYQGEDIVIQLPGNLTVYDIDWLAVYCVRYKHNYGHVMIPKNLDVPPALGQTKVSVDIGEVPKPRVLPEFRRLVHGLRSGNIIILNAKTFYIPNLHYDGNGPDAYFWVGNGSAPDTTGIKVPNEMGSLDVLRGYQGEDIVIQLPGNLTVYDIDWLAVYCVRYKHNYGHVMIPKNLDVPPALGQTKVSVDIGEVPKPRVLPEFRRLAHGLRSGNIIILNAKTFYIPNLHYDGNGPDAYFWVGNGSAPDTTGIKVPNEMGSLDVLRGYQGEDIVIQLPGNLTVYDIDWLAVYCVRYKHNYGHVMIPKNLDVPPALGQTKVSVDIGEVSKPRVLPEFRRLAHGLRSGNITILNAKTFYIPNLHYDGNGPDVYFWVGNGSAPDTTGIKVPNEKGSLDVLRGYQGEDIVIQLPGNLTVYDIDWLAVYCVKYKHNYGHVMIPKDLDVPPALGQTKVSVDIGEVPKPRVLPEFRRLAHGLRSGNITILNAKTFYIPNLHYDGNGPDAYFWVGNGSAPDTTGIKVPNEMGSLDVLRGYQGEDILIQLPGNLTVYDIDWLAVYCVRYKHNYGHVMIPKDLDVPPALGQT